MDILPLTGMQRGGTLLRDLRATGSTARVESRSVMPGKQLPIGQELASLY